MTRPKRLVSATVTSCKYDADPCLFEPLYSVHVHMSDGWRCGFYLEQELAIGTEVWIKEQGKRCEFVGVR